MDYSYAVIPFFAWFMAGTLKFLVNSIRARRLAFDLIGYGGLPSTHSSIVSAATALVGLKEGVGHPAFGVALCFAFITLLDASSLRRQVGAQAAAINRLAQGTSARVLRERVGHTPVEIGSGVVIGIVCAWAINTL